MTVDAVLAPSTLPFALPDFAAFAAADYEAAFTEGFARHRAEVATIAQNPDPATFTNTVEAMERAGMELGRVAAVFFSIISTDRTDELEDVQAKVSPAWSAHYDAILMDRELFARIDDLYHRRAALDLDPESLRLLERYHSRFTRAGAALGADAQDRLKQINTHLPSSPPSSPAAHSPIPTRAPSTSTPRTISMASTPMPWPPRKAAEDAGTTGDELALGYPLNQPNLARSRTVRRGAGCSKHRRRTRAAMTMTPAN
ncbi:Peptidyl-dipeptidase Dcp OS=Tsukamurella paurometabola (strain ATCC 8368 / DSM / CCUG 35730/ CIP 100753 / JCM 10117 / KCTC 9821 / NBRC 16120 / NCIMB 702349/ NCTC 13040) OX=521096 GN=Tpau_2784 PE=3 SV=1 [Tsukamurella paurometabola]